MVRLIEILKGQLAQPWELAEAKSLLRLPWCWPADDELHASARSLTELEGPTALSPGEVCLVSVDQERASLWRWTDAWKGLVVRQLIEDAEQSEMLSWSHACRHVPLIASPHLLRRRPTCRALKIASSGTGAEERALTGTSFGLALGVSSASYLLGAPVPADVVALAALGEAGETIRVDSRGLELKLRVLGEHALGVKQILVHPDQESEARRFIGSAVSIVKVRSLREAIACLWPDASQEVRSRWQHAETAREANEQLYRMALENSPSVLAWRPVASSAALLRDVLSDDAVAARKARKTEEIAKRHVGPIDQPLSWAVVEGQADLPHSDWLETLAHDVQTWSDSGATADECVAAAESAMREVAPPGKRHPADLKLMGAVGRALAAAGQTTRAVGTLRDAIRGWRQLRNPNDASYPICELVRVLAFGPTRSELDVALAEDVAWARQPDIGLSDTSASFIALAVGRGLVTCGEAERGMAELAADAAPWNQGPPHVRLARLRWMARGHAVLGRFDEAKRIRSELEEAVVPGEADPNLELAHLDAALETAADPAPLITALLTGAERREFQRLEAEVRRAQAEVSMVELGRYFSDRYRY